MKDNNTTKKPIVVFLAALLLLCFAFVFTFKGVTQLSVFIYAAAPCYFLSTVLFSASLLRRRMRAVEVKKTDIRGWF